MMVPALNANEPENVFTAAKVSVPVPLLVIPPAPLTMAFRLIDPVAEVVNSNPPLATVPPTVKIPPVAALIVGAEVENVKLLFTVMVPEVALLTKAVAPPVKVKALPLKTKFPAPLEKLIVANVVPVA
jgi:hypothetical protein